MMSKLVQRLTCLLLCCISTPLFATAFNYPSSLVHIPTVQPMEKGDYSISTHMGFYDESKSEFDSLIDYAVTHRVKLGMAMIRSTEYVGHAHWQFYNGKKFGAAAGVLNISGGKNMSSWDGYPLKQNIAYSNYVVTKYTFNKVALHTGFGTGQFMKGDPGVKRGGAVSGLFWAVEFPIRRLTAVYEFDGKDYNIGIKMPLSRTAELHLALTELFLDKSVNANYNNSPLHRITFGFTFFGNRYRSEDPENAALTEKIKTMDEMILEMKESHRVLQTEAELYKQTRVKMDDELVRMKVAVKDDTRYIMEKDQQKKDKMRQHYLGMNQEISEKVISLYYESFELFYKKDFFKAIDVLQQAIILDPYMPQLYVRMGSIYYELGMKKEAKDSWKKAYALDPENEELTRLLNPSELKSTKKS